MRVLLKQIATFGLIGVFNAGVDAAVFFAALATITSSLVVANLCAWLVAVTSSYLLNSRYTFAATSGRKLRLRDYLFFAGTQSGGFLANTAVLLLTAPYMPLPLAKLFGIGAGFVVNFTLARFLVFRKQPT
jgi:putative flippase GtrA